MPPNMKRAFRELLARDEIVVAPGAHDAFAARVIERAGFKAAFVGGGNVNAVRGRPDGEATRTEYLERVKEITDVLEIPILVDIDTGFEAGSALDLMRTIKECEHLGVAAVHCEDQETAIKTGGFASGTVVPLNVMLKKIEAALEAREDPDFVFIARTDSRMRYGLEEALERGRSYARAGADMIVVTGLQDEDELKRAIDYVDAPLLMYNGASTADDVGINPLTLSAKELEALGVKMVTFGNGILRAAAKAMEEFADQIRVNGTDRGFVDRMITRREMYEIVGTPARNALRKRFIEDA